ncbi:hypothetical protein MFRU_036g00040 [Monilinia fructicola]|nr:hypothetical protein MFRU_036g00040 [Monilinia fructicola]
MKMHILLPRLISNSNIYHGEPPSPSSSTLTHFHLFPNLPTELRYRIWRLAIQPRVLEPSLDFPNGEQTPEFSRRRPPPALFSTTHESRLICLDEYLVHEFREKPFYIHPDLDTLFLALNNRIAESLSYTEPFYSWLISHISTLALEIAFDQASDSISSSIFYTPVPLNLDDPLLPFTPTRTQNMWIYSLAAPSATIYLTFHLAPARPKHRPTPPHSPSYPIHSYCPPSNCPNPFANKYADRTRIMEHEDEIRTNVPWSKLLPKPKSLPDPMAIKRRLLMERRLKIEKRVVNNVSYMSHKVLRE